LIDGLLNRIGTESIQNRILNIGDVIARFIAELVV
jgi:hypothetical protein